MSVSWKVLEFALFQIRQICVTLRTCSVKELWTVAYLLPVLLLMNWCIFVCTTVTMFLKCSVINSRCFLEIYMLSGNSLEKCLDVPGKFWKSSGI